MLKRQSDEKAKRQKSFSRPSNDHYKKQRTWPFFVYGTCKFEYR